MRLDKFLKMTRLIKRRELANQLCDKGGVSINGKVAKAAATVKLDDIIGVRFGNRQVRVKVLGFPTKAVGNQVQAAAYIETLEDTAATSKTGGAPAAIDEEAL